MINDIIDILIVALSRVEEPFFRISTTYEPTGIIRERVFCYELYHQLRDLIPTDSPFSLNGEIDKRGHIDFAKQDRKNPDFIFHIPGTHSGNCLVIEVKGNLIVRDILKDFTTIATFIESYNYSAGVL